MAGSATGTGSGRYQDVRNAAPPLSFATPHGGRCGVGSAPWPRGVPDLAGEPVTGPVAVPVTRPAAVPWRGAARAAGRRTLRLPLRPGRFGAGPGPWGRRGSGASIVDGTWR